jgi:hypothetical protein
MTWNRAQGSLTASILVTRRFLKFQVICLLIKNTSILTILSIPLKWIKFCADSNWFKMKFNPKNFLHCASNLFSIKNPHFTELMRLICCHQGNLCQTSKEQHWLMGSLTISFTYHFPRLFSRVPLREWPQNNLTNSDMQLKPVQCLTMAPSIMRVDTVAKWKLSDSSTRWTTPPTTFCLEWEHGGLDSNRWLCPLALDQHAASHKEGRLSTILTK